MASLSERLAVLESTQPQLLQELKDLKKSVDDITSLISKYQGFVGGIVFLMTAIGMFLYKFVGPLWQLLSGKTHG